MSVWVGVKYSFKDIIRRFCGRFGHGYSLSMLLTLVLVLVLVLVFDVDDAIFGFLNLSTIFWSMIYVYIYIFISYVFW